MIPSSLQTAPKALTIVASPSAALRQQLLRQLSLRNCRVEEACGGAEALAMLESSECESLLIDKNLSDLDVAELISMIRLRFPLVDVRMISPEDSNCFTSHRSNLPVGSTELFRLLQDTGHAKLPKELANPAVQELPSKYSAPAHVDSLPGMIGRSSAMKRVYHLARLVAARKTTILLTGETGTGKELVARALHVLSPRRDRPFVVINCAAIPETLLEAELFGYNRGAFTGAFQSRMGRLQMAQSGTLLLDEVGDLPLSMQAKFLRFLQEGEVQRLGSSDALQIDVRVIAATNADLRRLVNEGRFRDDLYYRLAVFPIELDPLRLRREDIILLGSKFLDNFSQETHTPAKSFSPAATRALENYEWPGNVRELRQVIERAFILAEEQREIRPEHFPCSIANSASEKNFSNVA